MACVGQAGATADAAVKFVPVFVLLKFDVFIVVPPNNLFMFSVFAFASSLGLTQPAVFCPVAFVPVTKLFPGNADLLTAPFAENILNSVPFVAAIGVVIIAAIGAIAGYIDNYYTESVAQYVANDLRQKIYNHLQKLSLQYYDSHKIGNILSTITDDVLTIQSFASTALLSILIDSLTIIGMVVLMFYLNWDFALIAVGITPFLLLFVSRFKKAVKAATHEVRKNQSEIVSVLQQGLESVRSVKAFGRQDLEEKRLKDVSLQTVQAALKARRVKSLLSPIVAVTVSVFSNSESPRIVTVNVPVLSPGRIVRVPPVKSV